MKSSLNFNIWEYLYYRTIIFYSGLFKNKFYDARGHACLLITACICLNFLSIIFLLLPVLLQENYSSLFKNSLLKYIGGGLSVVFFFLCLRIFGFKRHEAILLKYQEESLNQSSLRGSISVLYVIFAIIFFAIATNFGKTI